MGFFEGDADIFAIAGGGDADEHVARATKGLDLSTEDGDESVIVRDGGHDGGIGGERDGSNAAALALEAAYKFRGEVLCVGGAATVSAPQDFAAGVENFHHFAGDGKDYGRQVADGLKDGAMLNEGAGKDFRGIGLASDGNAESFDAERIRV
jgi:hypothetical protein